MFSRKNKVNTKLDTRFNTTCPSMLIIKPHIILRQSETCVK